MCTYVLLSIPICVFLKYMKSCCVECFTAPELPESMLPLGMSAEDSRTKLMPVQPSKFLNIPWQPS